MISLYISDRFVCPVTCIDYIPVFVLDYEQDCRWLFLKANGTYYARFTYQNLYNAVFYGYNRFPKALLDNKRNFKIYVHNGILATDPEFSDILLLAVKHKVTEKKKILISTKLAFGELSYLYKKFMKDILEEEIIKGEIELVITGQNIFNQMVITDTHPEFDDLDTEIIYYENIPQILFQNGQIETSEESTETGTEMGNGHSEEVGEYIPSGVRLEQQS